MSHFDGETWDLMTHSSSSNMESHSPIIVCEVAEGDKQATYLLQDDLRGHHHHGWASLPLMQDPWWVGGGSGWGWLRDFRPANCLLRDSLAHQ